MKELQVKLDPRGVSEGGLSIKALAVGARRGMVSAHVVASVRIEAARPRVCTQSFLGQNAGAQARPSTRG